VCGSSSSAEFLPSSRSSSSDSSLSFTTATFSFSSSSKFFSIARRTAASLDKSASESDDSALPGALTAFTCLAFFFAFFGPLPAAPARKSLIFARSCLFVSTSLRISPS
jgi:hypothetical protein